MISDKKLKEDAELMNKIQYYRNKLSMTNEEQIALQALEHEYYVLNADIRLHWKLY
jgi:hypothetical protein